MECWQPLCGEPARRPALVWVCRRPCGAVRRGLYRAAVGGQCLAPGRIRAVCFTRRGHAGDAKTRLGPRVGGDGREQGALMTGKIKGAVLEFFLG